MSSSVLALLLADSRTPAGGYAHSAGLEAAIEAGLGVAGVPAFAAARLETVGIVEAAFAAATCAAAAGGLAALLALDDELAARTPSPPLRAAARQLGRALLRLAGRLWPADALLAGYGDASAWTPRPVVLGAVAARAGLTPLDVARLSLYEDAASVTAAAVKLLPLDAADATAWVAALAPRVDALAVAAAAAAHDHAAGAPVVGAAPSAADPLAAAGLPAAATPLLDLRSLQHDQSMGRLFVT